MELDDMSYEFFCIFEILPISDIITDVLDELYPNDISIYVGMASISESYCSRRREKFWMETPIVKEILIFEIGVTKIHLSHIQKSTNRAHDSKNDEEDTMHDYNYARIK